MAFPARSLWLSLLASLAAGLAPARAEEPSAVLEEHLTVHATRLADQEEPVQTVPAHVTVLTRQDLARSGARTLQDALALEAGVLVYDQVGNDLEKTLDLRGFANGSGTAVFVDGVRLNDPRNNSVALESIPIEAVDRIEITRGSAAGLVGGGSEAGVVHVLTRPGGDAGGSLSAAAGSDGGLRASGHLQATLAGVELFASAAHDGTDGFRRRNGDGDLDRFAVHAGLPLSSKHRLDLTALGSNLDTGAPGALTRSEFEADPWQSQHNVVDRDQGRARQAGLAYRGKVGNASLAADAYVRGMDAEISTTGRAAPLFGGFFLDTDTRVVGSTVQAIRRFERNALTAGAEWSDGKVDARGWSTSAPDFTPPPSATPDSDNRTERRTLAVFVHESFAPNPNWALHAGLRADWDKTAYRDFQGSTSTGTGGRDFSQVTGRAGVAWNPSSRNGAWASYAESFLPPTAEDLFSFPGFGSNPSLEPEVSQSWEIGWRHTSGVALELTAAAFRIDTRDEIVFDPDAADIENPFGRNVNTGETRRDGFEASARGRATAHLSWFARATVLDAKFRVGPASGNTVPLVPRRRLAAGLDLDLTETVRLHGDALHVGSQVLDNDDTHTQPELPGYTVVRASVAWQVQPQLALFVEGRNLFDERYATRGIYAFDFSTFHNDVFWTPAPGRRWLGGATWTF